MCLARGQGGLIWSDFAYYVPHLAVKQLISKVSCHQVKSSEYFASQLLIVFMLAQLVLNCCIIHFYMFSDEKASSLVVPGLLVISARAEVGQTSEIAGCLVYCEPRSSSFLVNSTQDVIS
jgi:hypothetical protein